MIFVGKKHNTLSVVSVNLDDYMSRDLKLANLSRRNMMKATAALVATGAVATISLKPNNDEKLNYVNSTQAVEHNERLASHLAASSENEELAVKDNVDKIERFDDNFEDDIFLPQKKLEIFNSTLKRVQRVQKTIGYANFNLVSFDEMLMYAHRFPSIGKFTQQELMLIEELFSFDADRYGFYGDKVIKNLTDQINKKDTVKIAGSGHYLFQGDALKKFKQLQSDVGPDLILTSGVRSVVKQLHLFLAKLKSSQTNLSMASRSLAPPGHSYHGIGDFDIGKRGFGINNFTAEFSNTAEYQKLIKLNYIDLRYTQNNQVGVRYEPWHIKVV